MVFVFENRKKHQKTHSLFFTFFFLLHLLWASLQSFSGDRDPKKPKPTEKEDQKKDAAGTLFWAEFWGNLWMFVGLHGVSLSSLNMFRVVLGRFKIVFSFECNWVLFGKNELVY